VVQLHPKDLKYTSTHEWVRVEGDRAVIGITDHAQSELGDIVYVELPDTGAMVRSGSLFGTVESVKTVSDLISPISGEIVDVNHDLTNTPEVINDDPYGSGWLAVVRMSDLGELDKLMSVDQYETLILEH
jgi:glycine cleavage system H protein